MRLFLKLHTLELYLTEKKQKIALSGSQNIEILLDKDLFLQLCYNLIWNFIKYAGSNTTLFIYIHSKKIEFRDSKMGYHEKKFPFFQKNFIREK